ncbi:glycosyltransferase family 2 protein [Eubacterium ventriosum]|jgi:glycosyltransferase involved in cell wall biosynthesis|uniref:glycosyltransferase family 2 protein n=1 Tax=Eubacterium ventriosum TaxID=39496 RepID=UPI003520747B
MKTVSIIIPVYNIVHYIERCVDSVINQTFNNCEIIIVDDGSTDGGYEKCDNLAKKDKRIKILHKINGGISEARNRGIEIATGDYLFFLDGDDYIEKNTIETLVNLLEINKADVSVVFKTDHNDRTEKIFIGNGENAFIHLLDYSAIEMWGKLFKTELFKNIRFPIGKQHEDMYTLPSVLLSSNKIVVFHKGYYHYEQRDKSIMGEIRKGKIKELVECYIFCVSNIKRISNKRIFVKEVQKRYFYQILWYYYNVIGIIKDKQAKKQANKQISKFYRSTILVFWRNSNISLKDKLLFTRFSFKC